MNLRIATCSLAISATFAGVLPLNASAAPTVAFVRPTNGATISGNLYQSSACEVRGSNITRVRFYLNSTSLNTEEDGPWNCNLDTRKFANGSYTLRAVAYDTAGVSRSTQIGVRIQNGTTSTPTPTAPSVSWRAPAEGATLKGSISLGSACEVTGSGIYRVAFHLDSTALNTDSGSPWQCAFDTTKFANGTHTLKAVASNSAGAASTITRTVNIQNTTTTTPPPTGTAPTVSFKSPLSGQTLSGALWSTCEVVGTGFNQVVFSVDGKTTLNTKNVAPWNCNLKTDQFPDGQHTLMALAKNTNTGASATTQVTLTFKNGNTPTPTEPTPTDPAPTDPAPTDPTTPPPSTGTRAVPTFESLGVYWKPGTNPGSAGCTVQYRKQGESAWKQGLNLWYDSRNAECRGSIVHLAPGTTYEMQLGLPGKAPSASLTAKTWSETFPIAKTVQVASGSGTLNITQGGSPSGYVLYTGPATLDAQNAADFNVTVSAPYVIIRGLTLKGARVHSIKLLKGTHDVVIEDNDISEWGRFSGKTSSDGWKIAVNMDSGIYASCYNDTPWLTRTIIQRNKIHHPRYGSNSWSDGHPSGSNAVHFTNCGGNHVFRHNELYSETGRYFMDGYGGGENFSNTGFPNADSDVYANRIQHAWDDAIETEGANNNVRVWGNYFDNTATGVASTSSSQGPIYIWRNVWNRSRNKSRNTLDGDNRLYMFKSGSQTGYGNGRRYVFHNTMLQAPPPAGSVYPLGGGMGLMGPGGGQNLTNTVSRNNIFHIWKTWWSAIDDNGTGTTGANDLDHDLVTGNVNAYAGAEPNRVVGTPVYAPGHGWSAEGSGNYQLAPSSPGYDRGTRIPNFNDAFTGAAPDMGAHEAGTPAMKLGRQ